MSWYIHIMGTFGTSPFLDRSGPVLGLGTEERCRVISVLMLNRLVAKGARREEAQASEAGRSEVALL